jgi:hypothetical protein
LEEKKKSEDIPSEGTVDETCKNIVSFLKLASGFERMNTQSHYRPGHALRVPGR